MRFITLLIAFTTFFVYSYTQTNEVIVKDLKLFVNSEEFFIKAVAYNPVPLGYAGMKSDLTGGAGYCSPLQTMWTEWRSACYDSDYFSTTIGAPGATAPSNGWFTNLWQRDFPVMKAMGTNTLRLYNANPSTAAATTLYSNVFLKPYGKSHIGFMDYAHQFGMKIIFPLIGDHTLMVNTPTAEYKRYIMWQIDEIGNHPALLMYTVGNELNFDSDPTLVPLVNKYVGFARSYQKLRWNRRIPITSAVVDLPGSYDMLAATLDVDIFTTNAGYRGISLTDLWSGNTATKGWWKLSCQYNKPVFIGEIGWHDIDNSIMKTIPTWFNQIWLDTIRHIDQGCIGGTVFEYSDEIYSKADPYQRTMGVVSFQESVVNGKSSLEQFAFNPDTVVLKEIYDYVANGQTPQGVAANFNTDIFAFIGRAPYTLSTLPSTSICAANFTLKSCPTQNSYDCSANGICDRSAGTCRCAVGWSGADCSVGVCTGSATCSGKGECIIKLSPPFCACNDGSDGIDCSAPRAVNACPIGSGWSTACGNGNGICSNSTWTCSCNQGWNGPACSVPTGVFVSGSSTSSLVASSTTGSVASSSTGAVQSTSSAGSVQSSTSGRVQSSSTGTVRPSSTTQSSSTSTAGPQSSTSAQSSTGNVQSSSATVITSTASISSSSTTRSSSSSCASVQSSTKSASSSTASASSTTGSASSSTAGPSSSTVGVSSSTASRSSSTVGTPSSTVSSSTSTQSASTSTASTSSSAVSASTSTAGITSSTGSASSSTVGASSSTTENASSTGSDSFSTASTSSSSTGIDEPSSTGNNQASSSSGIPETSTTANIQSSTGNDSSSTGSAQSSTTGTTASSTGSNEATFGNDVSLSAATSTTGQVVFSSGCMVVPTFGALMWWITISVLL